MRSVYLIQLFNDHKVAGNLIMWVMILAGIISIYKLNIQFFPDSELNIVTVRVDWQSGSADDVEQSITSPLESKLKNVENLRELKSTSTSTHSLIVLEFEQGADPEESLNQVKQQVDQYQNLPSDVEEPVISRLIRYEPVARLLVTGPDTYRELRNLAHRFEHELVRDGIDKVDVVGLPEEQISIQVSSQALQQLGRGLDDIGQQLKQLSVNMPGGTMGQHDGARELRAQGQQRSTLGFERLSIISDSNERVDLGAIADIVRGPKNNQLTLQANGHPAVELHLQRAVHGDSLNAAKTLQNWLDRTRPALPPEVDVHVYFEAWKLIDERISMLVKNGIGGLILVFAALCLFLGARVAFWVAVGIPVSFLATIAVLYLLGGSINMVSLFALIMALGIIVDDAIVVAENTHTHFQSGLSPSAASEAGATKMLPPVMASSLTTVAAFFPLMLVQGVVGDVLFAIPLVIICVIFASLIECFLVLPSHLRNSLSHSSVSYDRKQGQYFDRMFLKFREKKFRKLVYLALEYRATTISAVVALLLLFLGLLIGGRIEFNFFPTPESRVVYANATFVAGTPRSEMAEFMHTLQTELSNTEDEFLLEAGVSDKGLQSNERIVRTAVTQLGATAGSDAEVLSEKRGDYLGSIVVELSPSEQREVRNNEFIDAWQKRIDLPPRIKSLSFTTGRAGPPGKDIHIRLTGTSQSALKDASTSLQDVLSKTPGVSAIEDDSPYGREQLIYKLTPVGEAAGLTVADVGRQLRMSFDGLLVHEIQENSAEIEVRVKLPLDERDYHNSLQRINVRLPSGEFVPLTTVVSWESRQGFQSIRHANGKSVVNVTASVDPGQINANKLLTSLQKNALSELVASSDIAYSFEGRSAEMNVAFSNLIIGLFVGLAMIYLILAMMFSSYVLPLIVMIVIPFAVIGALAGHLVMNIELTMLSLFGLFGLSGIVINDSIILLNVYIKLRERGIKVMVALIEASCNRLRAVLLTSLTTIAGLAPLMFETSLQAQFLIPMATSIAFGLAFSTVLVLLVIPALVACLDGREDAAAAKVLSAKMNHKQAV